MEFEIMSVLKHLSERRKIFSLEADFQFAFAWSIKEIYGDLVDVRLEHLTSDSHNNFYIDVLVIWNNKDHIPIELKYKTVNTGSPIKTIYGTFNLKAQGAQDLGRFDYLADIERIETYKKLLPDFLKGYALIITNDVSYTKETSRATKSKEFSLGNGLIKKGTMSWREGSSIESRHHRKSSIILSGAYPMNWEIFSDLGPGKNRIFRLLIAEIK